MTTMTSPSLINSSSLNKQDEKLKADFKTLAENCTKDVGDKVNLFLETTSNLLDTITSQDFKIFEGLNNEDGTSLPEMAVEAREIKIDFDKYIHDRSVVNKMIMPDRSVFVNLQLNILILIL